MPGNMNSGGRNKRSATSHILRGTFRKDRHGDDATPEPPIGTPKPPVRLVGQAKAEWGRVIVSLSNNKTLSIVDAHALFQYCELFAETQELKADYWRLRKSSTQMLKAIKGLTGAELVKALGHVTQMEHEISRLTTKLRQNRLAVKSFLVEFGLTPSARTRVKQIGGGGERKMSKVDQFRQAKTTA